MVIEVSKYMIMRSNIAELVTFNKLWLYHLPFDFQRMVLISICSLHSVFYIVRRDMIYLYVVRHNIGNSIIKLHFNKRTTLLVMGL